MKSFKNGGNPLSTLSYKPLNSKSSLVNPPNKFEFQNSQNLNDKNNLLPLYSKYYSDIPHDYLLEIWENLKAEESVINNYDLIIKKQKDVNEKMRAILIDWIVEVHEKCKLKAETLYLVISIIDRFLTKKEILRTHLQLVGVAALLIACKYEEIYVPDIREFVRITDNAFDKKQILQAEVEILLALEYNMTLPSCLRFFEIIALNFNFNNIEFTFGNYLLELFLFDMSSNKFPPSMIALGVAYIIMKTNNYSNYKELYKLFLEMKYIRSQDESDSLKELAKLIYSYLDKAKYLKSVFVKYSREENHQVSVLGMGNLCVRK